MKILFVKYATLNAPFDVIVVIVDVFSRSPVTLRYDLDLTISGLLGVM